jgi:hypothetical protein
MENIVSEFKTDNLEIRLTNENLFVKTLTTEESFELKSVAGIQITDLTDEFNKELSKYHLFDSNPYWVFLFGCIFLILSFCGNLKDMAKIVYFCILGICLFVFGIYLIINSKKVKPTLMSSLQVLTVSDTSKKFIFDKTKIKSGNLLEFEEKVKPIFIEYIKKKYPNEVHKFKHLLS